MADFELDPRLAQDTWQIGQIAGCRLLLMNDARYPWLILVPEITGVTELHELSRDTFTQVTRAIADISKGLQSITGAPKMNIAALGNQVPMLHIHIIARRSDDAAWPGPVWGHGDSVPYSEHAGQTLLTALQETLLSD
jgi:diadenosine tetraphosphate (Ap4A) HIT family hydrolase